MRAGLFRCFAACVLFGAALFATPAAQAQHALEQSIVALDSGDPERAATLLDQVEPAQRARPDALFQRGMIAFHLGNYEAAVTDMEKAIADAPRSPHLSDWRKLLEWATSARDITRNFLEAKSRDGRYVVRYAEGPDAVLVPYALDALERADKAIAKHLGIKLPSPVRLELYPSARVLAKVSSLTLEHIETTGTVALCKWNRLMVTTPRSLLYGYPWLDTINHELVHLALTRASKNQAPVWFHEGLAKLFERTWRGVEPAAYLQPATDALLISAAHESRLISFDRMHPSIAMLPSQEDAALAFAQVVTFLERFRSEEGDKGLTSAIQHIARGEDARAALSKVAGEPFSTIEGLWKDSLAARPLEKGQVPKELRMHFVEGGGADESLDVSEERARKHLRVGDLLWGRGKTTAAAKEYERGQRYDMRDPILASRVARSSLATKDANRALDALRGALATHPNHAPLHALRGTALAALAKNAEAAEALREAIRLNPFDPTPHCTLARVSSEASETSRERAACSQLGGSVR
jgi:tetratricopeptide (TPR) repeat protein